MNGGGGAGAGSSSSRYNGRSASSFPVVVHLYDVATFFSYFTTAAQRTVKQDTPSKYPDLPPFKQIHVINGNPLAGLWCGSTYHHVLG